MQPQIITCSVEDCEKPSRARGWCVAHYRRWRVNGDPKITLTPGLIIGTPEERFWAKVDPCRTDSCALWLGSLDTAGYGRFVLNGRARSAHLFLVGPAPDGFEWDHVKERCGHRNCIWPEHLEAVTHTENVRRGNAGKRQREQTHCKHGHPFNETNTYIDQAGKRSCLTCRSARNQLYYQAKKNGFS